MRHWGPSKHPAHVQSRLQHDSGRLDSRATPDEFNHINFAAPHTAWHGTVGNPEATAALLQNHYGELTRYSSGIQLGTSTVLPGVETQGRMQSNLRIHLLDRSQLGGAATGTGAAGWLSR